VADDAAGAHERFEFWAGGGDARRLADHVVGDSGEPLDKGRDFAARVDEPLERLKFGTGLIEADGADLDDSILLRVEAGGFEIKRNVGASHGANIRANMQSTAPTRLGQLTLTMLDFVLDSA
jgi:hypothetical protein